MVKQNRLFNSIIDCDKHFYSTWFNNKLLNYVATWFDSINKIEYEIIANTKQTSGTVIRYQLMENIGINFIEIFRSYSFFEIPIIDNMPDPEKLIVKLLNLKAFS